MGDRSLGLEPARAPVLHLLRCIAAPQLAFPTRQPRLGTEFDVDLCFVGCVAEF